MSDGPVIDQTDRKLRWSKSDGLMFYPSRAGLSEGNSRRGCDSIGNGLRQVRPVDEVKARKGRGLDQWSL